VRTRRQRIRRRLVLTGRLYAHLWRKLIGLDGAELRDMLWAQAVLVWAQLAVRTRPRGSFVGPARSGLAQPRPDSRSTAGTRIEEAKALAKAMNRAAYHGVFRPQCLVRSVALQHMLESRGIHGSQVRVGVRMSRGQFEAHAWVEYEKTVIGDRDYHVATFTELGDGQLVARL
jgi:hypothetical protein